MSNKQTTENHKSCLDCKYYDGLFCSKDLVNF